MRAHSVQSSLLRLISRDGHVFGLPTDLSAIVCANGVPAPRLIGVNDASTFTGFCGRHDNALFAAIEKQPIRACEQHAGLLAYRATCREFYAKVGAANIGVHRATLDRGLSPAQQIEWQARHHILQASTESGLKDVRTDKQALDHVVTGGDYSPMRYYVIWFAAPIDIMCSGSVQPDCDFNGQLIQDLGELDTVAQSITVTLAASQDRGFAFFAWHDMHDEACVALLRSMNCLADSALPHAIVRFVTGNFENQFWRPAWWEALDDRARGYVLERLAIGTHPEVPIPRDYLTDDGGRAVSWRVVGRETNVVALSTGSA